MTLVTSKSFVHRSLNKARTLSVTTHPLTEALQIELNLLNDVWHMRQRTTHEKRNLLAKANGLFH